MDTSYADAVARLEDEINSACARARDELSDSEIVVELRRIAREIEDGD